MGRNRFWIDLLFLACFAPSGGRAETGSPDIGKARSVRVVTFLDAGSDSIEVPPPEMTEILLAEVRKDPNFSVVVVPREPAQAAEPDAAPDVVLTGFYRLREGKIFVDVVLALRTGKAVTRQFAEAGPEAISGALHELLLSAYRRITIGSSPPGARLRFDGIELVLATPAVFEGVLQGKHSIALEMEGYQPLQSILEVEHQSVLDLSLEALPSPPTPVPAPTRAREAFGTVKFKKMPWAKIYVDGHLIGDTTTLRKIRLEVGVHEIRMLSPEAGTKTLRIDVQEDQTYAASF